MPDTADAPRDLTRTVLADAPGRLVAEPVTMARLTLRIDATHELPIVVETERGDPIARFAQPGDAAIFVSTDRRTLPAAFLRAWQDRNAGL